MRRKRKAGATPCSSRAESRGNANGTTTAMGLKTGRVKPRLNATQLSSSRGGTLGLIVVRFDGVREVARNISYGFADRLVGKLVEAFSGQLPDQAFGARIGDSAVAVFLPEATRPECENLAAAILRAMEQVRLPDPLIGRPFGVQPHAGYALYPQDMDGTRQRSSEEHGRILLHKAQLAAEVARTRGPGGSRRAGSWGTAGCFSKAGTSGRCCPFRGS